MKLTTTLNKLKSANACASRYEHLVKKLGGVTFDHDAPINLLTILEHNGTDDCLWALCATEQDCDTVARLMAADFAEAVLPLYESKYPNDPRPRQAIEAARACARGEINPVQRDAAGDAAGAAAWAAAWAAAGAAAWAAAGAAARDAARDAQADIIRKYLEA
jgi:hypothetical protein